jgi:hypothetical protein
MRKLEIYQVSKVPPLTVVECDKWELDFSNVARLKCLKEIAYNRYEIVAEFLLNNIAGFKEV